MTHGLDETASAAAVAAYEAHRRPTVMRRMEEELERALDKCGGNLDYDTLVRTLVFPIFVCFVTKESDFLKKRDVNTPYLFLNNLWHVYVRTLLTVLQIVSCQKNREFEYYNSNRVLNTI